MPQIGWFEILIVVVLSIVIIGPKDFPIMLKKMGSWMGSLKRYFNELQSVATDVEKTVENEISPEKDLTNEIDNKKQNE